MNSIYKFINISIVAAILCTITHFNLYPQVNEFKDTLLLKKEKISPDKYFTIDSTKKDSIDINIKNSKFLPGLPVRLYSPEQDSLLDKARKFQTATAVRLRNDLKLFSDNWKYHIQNSQNPSWTAIEENMRIPSSYLTPLGNEIVQRQMMIADAQYSPVNRSPRVPTGLSMNISDIMVFLGMKEDVSPIMHYNLDEVEEVEIVIYSIQAQVVATLYNGKQPPGSYKYIWDGKNEFGRKLISGDYVGEIRIGNKKYVRKHIVIP